MAQVPRYYVPLVSAATPNPLSVMPAPLALPVNRLLPRERYKIILRNLGITEIVLGSISSVLAIALMAMTRPYYYGSGLTYSAQGIWCGALLIASGVLGIKAKSQPSVCMYNSNMAVSIVAATFMGILVILSGVAADYAYYGILAVFHGITGFIGFAGMVIAIIHSAYCCAGVCCRINNAYQRPVMRMTPHQNAQQPQQMVQLLNGQFISLQVQPAMVQGYPPPTIPITGVQMAHQQGSTLPQQQVSYPSPSTYVQAVTVAKNDGFQMQGVVDNPPDYSTRPVNHNA